MGGKHETAFKTLKETLVAAPILTIHDPSLPAKLDCDVSKEQYCQIFNPMVQKNQLHMQAEH